MEIAVLDACVLFKNGVRDFLLWLAEAGTFSPVWSDIIHKEWMRNRHAEFGDSMETLVRARSNMESTFPGANFDPDLATLKTISLPDMDDVHVVATAIAAEARTIVTYNEPDFPDEILARLGLRKERPDAFGARLFGEAQAEFIEGARLHRASLKKPTYDPTQYVDHIESRCLKQTAHLLRSVQGSI
jgi:predicted nucleic acid-binding protein